MTNIQQHIPPPIIRKFEYKSCEQINLDGKRVYLTPDGDKTPSVTTILSATKDMSHLNEWKKKVGNDAAKQITTEASARGSTMHNNLERFIANIERKTGNNLVHVQADKMATVIINNAFRHISEIWASEQSLYYPGIYSGTTDLVGVFDGNPAIMDFKQSNKPKKESYVEDYYLQLVSYILCHNKVYGTSIRHGHIFMCSQCLTYQQFDLTAEKFDKYETMWWNRVEQYYKL